MSGPKWEKVIKQFEFDIISELVLSDLVKLGYQRNIILDLFNQLQKKQFGEFIPGKKGRNGYSGRFIPNKDCPNKYTLFVECSEIKKSDKPEVEIKIKEKKPKEIKKVINLDEDLNTPKSHALNSLWHLSKNIVEDPTSNYVGYVCSVLCGELLTIHRVRGGGKPTIEEAVSDIWDSIKDSVKEVTTKNMNKKEAVISALMGKGIVVLSVPYM